MRTLKILAALMCYPEPEMAADFPRMAAVLKADQAIPPPLLTRVRALMTRLAEQRGLDAQMEYVGLFDGSPRRSLYLFEHIHGDSRSRGQAMADLLQHYRTHGLDLATEELPDYLPVFLEFLSTRPDAEARTLLGEVAGILALLQARLAARASDYATLFAALLAIAGRTADLDDIASQVASEAPEASFMDAPSAEYHDEPAGMEASR